MIKTGCYPFKAGCSCIVPKKLYEPKGSPEAKDMPVGTTKPKKTVAPDQYRRIKAELKS